MTALPDPSACRYCGMHHGPTCHTVKAIEYYQDGSIKRVEFKASGDYAQAVQSIPTVWPYNPPQVPTNTTGFAGLPEHHQPNSNR